MNYADMILDSVGVANLDEVNLSYMIVSVVIFQKFTWLVYCAIAVGDIIESHFSHSKQWMVGVQCPIYGKRH